MPAPELRDLHPPTTGRLDHEEAEAAGRRCEYEALSVSDERPGLVLGLPGFESDVVYCQALPADLDEAARPWAIGTHLAFEVGGTASRVEAAVGPAKGLRVRGSSGVLRLESRPAREHGRKDLGQERRALGRGPGLEARRILGAVQGPGAFGDDRTRIESQVHLHDGHAAHALAGEDRGRARRGAPLARRP